MQEKALYRIANRQQLVDCFRDCQEIGYERPYFVEVRPMTRSLEQNALLHSLFSELERQATYQNQKLTAEQWKVLMISAHTIATKENHRMVIGIEGEVVNLRESSAKMTVARMTSLIEYILAWAASNGVVINE